MIPRDDYNPASKSWSGLGDLKSANLLGGERGIMGGTVPSAKDLQLQADGKGYNEFQMNKIFNTMNKSFGRTPAIKKDLLKEDTEIIIIDQDDEV